jgi:hypothetical protein
MDDLTLQLIRHKEGFLGPAYCGDAGNDGPACTPRPNRKAPKVRAHGAK